MQRDGLSWGSYMQVAGGLMGLTWGLNRLRRGHGDWLTWTVTGVAAPLAANGLVGWLPRPAAGQLRRALPALTRTLT